MAVDFEGSWHIASSRVSILVRRLLRFVMSSTSSVSNSRMKPLIFRSRALHQCPSGGGRRHLSDGADGTGRRPSGGQGWARPACPPHAGASRLGV
eukprot:7377077-Prymnesium_polylepis.1